MFDIATHRPWAPLLCTLLLAACDSGREVAAASPAGSSTISASSTAALPASAAAPSARTLSCDADASIAISANQRLVNNTWNRASAGSFAWKQCLFEERDARSGAVVGHGWEWRWPSKHGLYAYPELVIGAKPWDAGPGNDARFPRRIADTPRMQLRYDAQTTGDGERNLAASLWFIKTPRVAAPPVETDIAAELMIWSDYTPAMLSNDGPVKLQGEIEVAGRTWQVWAARDWGGGADVKVRWTFIIYTAKTGRGGQLDVDVRRFIDDALARGLLKPDLYIASVELGNEIVSGSGRTLVRELSVTMP